ncbi:MAG: hypothetical protein FJX67_08810, partial [Alphaproteobacteria bacterium]|nr:hypothetical protein [Alphaproteobacteria bacterium]
MSDTIDLARTIGSYLAGTPARARVFVVLVLCAVTGLLFFATDFRYATERSNLTPSFVGGPWFASPAGVSILRADPSVAFLEPVPGQRNSYLVLNLPKHFPYDLVRVSVEVRADGLVSPSGRWHHARVTLFNFDASGKNLGHLPHIVADLTAPSEWRRHAIVVPMDPIIVRQQVVIHNSAIAGTFGVRSFAIDSVRERCVFTAIRLALIGVWISALAWVLYPLIRRPPVGRSQRAGLLVCAVVAIGALIPQPILSQTAGAAARGVEDAVRDGVVQMRA